MKFGSITTGIVSDGLVFNMDAANRASYPVQRTLAIAESGSCYNTLDTTQSGSFISDPQFITQPTSASCWTFDGVDDYIASNITFPDINIPGGTSDLGVFTISCWFKTISHVSTWNEVFGFQQGSQGASIYHATNNYVYVYANSNSFYVAVSIPLNQWCNATFTSDATGRYAYVNGVLGNTSTAYTTLYMLRPFSMGGDSIGNSPYNGNIANVQAYNRALSSSEVLHNYNALKGRFT